MTSHIKVAIRIRPLLATEQLPVQWATQNNTIYQIDDSGQKFGDMYSFDHIFGMNTANSDIYNDLVKDFVVSSMNGVNSTIFAYGQTSSGKTYTMLGSKTDTGLMPLTIENIFNFIESNDTRKFLIRVSYIEIYNEKINDLLDPTNKDIKIREHYEGGIKIQNVKEEIVSTRDQLYNYLKTGTVNKRLAATKINDRSSRSHTIFKIIIESTKVCESEGGSGSIQTSSLNLVDLAGSERVAQTKATGIRLKEGSHINKSLSALGLVILQLSDGQEYVNFRDSKLTWLLKDSLGGNAKTLIIATITPASVDDTSSTLAFAQRAKAVKNKPEVNEILTDAEVSKRYAALNARLKRELNEHKLRNEELQRTQEENFKILQAKIQMLENFQHGQNMDSAKKIPKRRHTIGFSKGKTLFPDIKELDLNNDSSGSLPSFEDLIERDNYTSINTLETIKEEDSISVSKTPESCLKIRLSALEKDYNELVTYTRDEDNIFMERANQLEKELKVANEKLFRYEHDEIVATELKKRFQVREEELVGRIAELEENIRKKEAHKNEDDNYNVDYISEQLICLYNILYSGNVKYDLDVTLTDKDEVISALKKENDKLRQNCFNANETHNFLKSEIEKMKTNNNKVLSEVENSCIANKQQMGKIEDSSNGKELEELITSVDKLKFEVVEKDRIISELQNSCALLTNEIEQMRSNVEKLSRELLEKNQSLSDVENNYTAIKRDMEKLEEDSFNSKEAYRHELDELKLNTDKLTLEIVEKDRIISELQSLRGENEKIPDDGELRSEELKKFKAKAEELAEKISALSEVENNYDAIRRDMEKMKEDFSNSKKSHMQELYELQTKADKLTLEIVEKDGIISEMQNSCALLRNENEKMLMDSESCREELNKFKSNVEQLNRELLERNESLSEVENNYSAIKRDMEKLEQDVSNSKEAYRQQLDELQTKADKLTLEIVEKDRIISQLQSLGSENEKIQDDDELRSEELKKFKAKAEELTEKISALSEVENKYDAIKRVMKKMKEDFSNSKKSHMQELYEIQTKTDKLTLEIVEKDRIISEMQNSYTLLRNENEKMLMDSESCREDLNKFKSNVEQLSRELQERNESLSAVENNYSAIKREMEKLKKDVSNSKEAYREELDELRINADKLTLEIVEKNSIIFELENKCTVLRNENEKILIDSESCEELKKFKSRADELSLLLLEKNKALSEVENQMKCKVERLTREIIEQQNNCGQLQQKMETLNKEFSRVCNENTFLKSEVDKLLSELKDKDKKVSSIESDCASLREELENTKQDFCNISLKNKQFQSNIEKMKCTIADYETNCHLKEQKLKLSELKIQKQKQLLSNAQTQISDLKASIAEKETLKYDISQYQLELRESNKKQAECVQLNERLTAELKILRENDSDKNYLSIDGVQEKDVATSDLLQKFETLLSLIVTHITNEQSTLLLKRHSQDQREYFKDFTRDLKSNNANLKHEFKTLRERKDCDFDKIAEYLVKSISIFGKYFKLEKSLLQSQIDQLESNNKAYLQEIIVLKDKQQDSNRIDCCRCSTVKSELSRVKEVVSSQEKELGKLKEKNAELKKDIFDKIGQNLELEKRLYAEQDRKVEVKTTELMKFYKENDIMQQQQIRMQQEEIRRYRHAATVNKSTVEVQCNILDPDLSLQDKYIVAKRICAARKAEVASLKMQIDELRNGRVTEKQAEVGHSVEVQCNILDTESALQEKYNWLKKLCVVRNEEITSLKAQIASLQS